MIDWKTVFLIHRAPDGEIAFAKKDADGHFNNLFSISRVTIESMIPQLADYFLENSYMLLNDPFAPAGWRNKAGEIVIIKNPLTGLPDVRREKKDFRWINACWVDLDFYKQDSAPSAIEASNQVRTLAINGFLPYPSIFLYTGRGLCVIWLVVGMKPPGPGIPLALDWPHPERAWQENRERCELINRVLVKRLKNLKPDLIPDPALTPINSYTRLPGSLNLKSGVRVQADITISKGGPLFYTLGKLSEILEIGAEHELEKKRYRVTVAKGSAPKRRRGWYAVPPMRIWDLKEVERFYGGFPQGMRRKALTFLAEWRHAMKCADDDIILEMEAMAARCRPPYPSDGNDEKVSNILKGVKKKRRQWTNDLICSFLKISYEMAKELNLETICPKELTEERKQEKRKEPGPRKRAKLAREIYYKQRLAQGGRDLSCRTISAELKNIGIAGSSYETVNKEFKKIKMAWLLSLKKSNGGKP